MLTAGLKKQAHLLAHNKEQAVCTRFLMSEFENGTHTHTHTHNQVHKWGTVTPSQGQENLDSPMTLPLDLTFPLSLKTLPRTHSFP